MPGAQPSETEKRYMHLEHDQLASERAQPLPRAELGNGAQCGLWALRVFCLVVSAMVIYTFVTQL